MSLLYWKEWREMRLIVLAAPVLIVALLIGYSVLVQTHVFEPGPANPSSGVAGGLLALTWLFSAALCGSSVMSPEVGSGTLRFLSMLPVRRGSVWRGKVIVGLVAALGCVFAATLAYCVFCAAAHINNGLDAEVVGLISSYSVLINSVLVFAVGCYMTMLLENSITALLATIVVSLITVFLTSVVAEGIGHVIPALNVAPDYGVNIYVCLFALLFFWLSYRTFQLGETLKTSKRFWVLVMWPRWVRLMLINVGIVIGALIGAGVWILN